MTDTETATTVTTTPPLESQDSTPTPESQDSTPTPESQDSTPPPTMESQAQDSQPKKDGEAKTPSGISLRIWPPTQRTREAVVTRLIETLSMPSILSKRYGNIPPEEATVAARVIEEEAFGVASTAASAEDDGIEILQVYSKEISKRMLESVKVRAPPTANTSTATSTNDSVDPNGSPGVGPTVTATEDVSSASVEAEA